MRVEGPELIQDFGLRKAAADDGERGEERGVEGREKAGEGAGICLARSDV